jgi:hypothetical protein
MAAKKKFIFSLIITMLVSIMLITSVAAQSGLDPSPPEEVVKLIFIHHSVGENWLADGYGNLGKTLQANNYYVSDTNYGWGPDGIGDLTDTLDWPLWFTGPDSGRYMEAVYTENDANAGGYTYYSRTLADPGGENQIIVFKSCYPNSDLGGSPTDTPAQGDDLTVASAKYVYIQLLSYFATRPDKLFVVVTSPPMQYISESENARAFNNWLVNDWLVENNYPYQNVAVFDLYNVLTHPDNHHRFQNGVIEHSTGAGSNTLYYDSSGDDHPNAAGSQKATDEFVTLLNVFYHQWLNDSSGSTPIDKEIPQDDDSEGTQTEKHEPPTSPELYEMIVIDDFESGPIPDVDYWVVYWDEAVDTSISCQPTNVKASEGTTSLQIDFNVLEESWASCELLFYTTQDWHGDGFSYNLQSSQASIPYAILFYYQQGDELGTSAIRLTAPAESVGQWVRVEVPWSEFEQQDSLVYPEVGRGMAFIVEGGDSQAHTGTLWIDDLRLGFGEMQPDEGHTRPPVPLDAAEDESNGENAPPDEGVESGGGGLPFCGSTPFLIFMLAFGAFTCYAKRE